MSTRLTLCNSILTGPKPIDVSVGNRTLPNRPEPLNLGIGSRGFLDHCVGQSSGTATGGFTGGTGGGGGGGPTTPTTPTAGPSDVGTNIVKPSAGPSAVGTNIIKPTAGPSSVGSNILKPVAGPSGLTDDLSKPVAGPSGVSTNIVKPAVGPDQINSTINTPAAGPSALLSDIPKPAAGPSGLTSEVLTEYSNQYSLLYDGVNDYVSTGYAPGASSGFSISMWIKSTNTTQAMSFASNGTSAGSPGGFQLISPSTTKAFYVLVKNSGGSVSVDANIGGSNARVDICDGKWHHLCATINGTSVKIYKDGGDAAGSGNTQGTPFATWTSAVAYDGNTGNPYYLGRNGAYAQPTNYWMDGNQDEVSMFEYELSGSQVSDIYNSGLPNDISSLNPTLWYRMGDNNGGEGTTITDQGSGGNDGTLVNGPTFSTDVLSIPQAGPSSLAGEVLWSNEYSVSTGTSGGLTVGETTAIEGVQNFSQAFWFKSSKNTDAILQVSNTAAGSSATNWIKIFNGGGVQFRFGGTSYVQGLDDPSLNDGEWHFLVQTYDAGYLSVYVDGAQVGVSNNFLIPTTAPTGWTDAMRFIAAEGNFDEWGVWDVTLDAANILALYNNGSPIALDTDSGNYTKSQDLVRWEEFNDTTYFNPAAGETGAAVLSNDLPT